MDEAEDGFEAENMGATMADTQPDDMEPGLTVEAAFRTILHRCCSEIDAHIAFVLDRDEAIGPHKTRVWLRRLVTALDAFAPVLKRKATRTFRDEAKRIFRDLGKVRDNDVLLENLPESERSAKRVEAVARLRMKVRQRMRDRSSVMFAPRLLRSVSEGSLFRSGPAATLLRAEPVERLAEAALDLAWEDCLRHRKRFGELGPGPLHEFRKDLKAMRYQTEFFAPFFAGSQAAGFRVELQRMQDLLGTATDAEVTRAMLGKGAGKQARDTVRDAVAKAEDIWRLLLSSVPWWRIEPRARLH
jgi:CHAD domain-containing protein